MVAVTTSPALTRSPVAGVVTTMIPPAIAGPATFSS
jgi:hypothetical protein